MPTWSRFQYRSSYTLPVSRLVINAQCCTLTMDLMHCGVRFLLCKVFNYTFPLLTVHVLVFEFYPATPWHCPDQFCLLRLRCILTWKTFQWLDALPGNPGAPVDPALVGSTFLALLFEMLDLLAEIWSSLLVLSSTQGYLPSYSLLVVSSWNLYKFRIVSYIAGLLQMLGLAFIKLFVLLSTLLILSKFLPSPGFYEGCVPLPYLMYSCAWASLLSQLDFQPHTGDPPLQYTFPR